MNFRDKIVFIFFFILASNNAFGQMWFEKEKIIGKVKTITENSYEIKGNDTILSYCKKILHFNRKGKIEAVSNCNDKDSIIIIYDEITDKPLRFLFYANGKLNHTYNLRYKGNISERYVVEDDKERLQFTFFYDEKNNLIKSILHTPTISPKSTISVLEYDNQNRLIKETVYREGYEATPLEITDYIYDKKNNYISTLKILEKRFERTAKIRHEFDEYGNIILFEDLDDNDKPIIGKRTEFRYRYDPYGNWLTKEFIRNFNTRPSFILNREITYYKD